MHSISQVPGEDEITTGCCRARGYTWLVETLIIVILLRNAKIIIILMTVIMINNSNMIEWSPIPSVIITSIIITSNKQNWMRAERELNLFS